MASATNKLQQPTEPTARRWLWVLFLINHSILFCLEKPNRGRGCNNHVCWHFALRRWDSKIVEAIADTIFALRGSSEWSVQRSRWGYCSLSLVPSHNRVSWRLLDWYILYTISLDSSMMYIRQMQILVQAQICTWLIVYTKTGAHLDISLRYTYVDTCFIFSFTCYSTPLKQ